MNASQTDPGRARGRWLTLGKAAVTLAILAWLASRVDLSAVAGQLLAARAAPLALGFALFLLGVAMGGLRWWMALRGIGEAARPGTAVALFWIGMAFSQVVPATAGDGLRVWLGTRQGWRLGPALASVLLERLAMLLTLLALVVATEPLLARRLGYEGGLLPPAALLLAGLAGVAGLLTLDRLAARWRHRRAVDALARLALSSRTLLRSRWAPPLAALTLAAQLNLALAGWCLSTSLGLPLSLLDNLLLIPLVILATVAPISVGGWGLREGLVVALLGHVGIAAPDALAYSFLLGAANVATSLPGLALWLARR